MGDSNRLQTAVLIGLAILLAFHIWNDFLLEQNNGQSLKATRSLASLRREKTKVVVFIPTSIQSSRRRFFVNRQFAVENWKRNDVIIFWVLGSKDGKQLELDLSTNITRVMNETFMSKRNTLVTDCRDSGDEENNANGTSSTTCKFFEAMRFIHQRYDSQYIWRGADDAYLNLQLFFKLMPSLPQRAMWLGQPRSDQNRVSDISLDKQPQLQKLFGLQTFPNNYMLGMGSAFTADVAMLLANWNIPPHLTWCEDVVVGLWMTIFRLQRVNMSPLFVNRAGSVANRWPLDYTYGNMTILLLHYIRDVDWSNIASDGSVFVSCPKDGKSCTDPFDAEAVGKQIAQTAPEYPAIILQWRQINSIKDPPPPPPPVVVTIPVIVNQTVVHQQPLPIVDHSNSNSRSIKRSENVNNTSHSNNSSLSFIQSN